MKVEKYFFEETGVSTYIPSKKQVIKKICCRKFTWKIQVYYFQSHCAYNSRYGNGVQAMFIS